MNHLNNLKLHDIGLKNTTGYFIDLAKKTH